MKNALQIATALDGMIGAITQVCDHSEIREEFAGELHHAKAIIHDVVIKILLDHVETEKEVEQVR